MIHAIIIADIASWIIYTVGFFTHLKAMVKHANGFSGLRNAIFIYQLCFMMLIISNVITDGDTVFAKEAVRIELFTMITLSKRLCLLICAMIGTAVHSGDRFEIFTVGYWTAKGEGG